MKKLRKILGTKIPKTEILNIWLSLFPMLLGVFIYSFLTVTTPSYFNLADDQFTRSMLAMLVIIPVPLVLNLMLMGTPKLDPLYKNYKRFARTYFIFRRVIIIFFDLLIIGTLAMLLGVNIDYGTYGAVTVGGLFVLIGAALKDTKQNYFFGIRTPWALMDEDNWNYTNQIGSRWFIWSGTAIAISGILGLPLEVLIIVAVLFIILMSAMPFYYSYHYYKKHQKHS